MCMVVHVLVNSDGGYSHSREYTLNGRPLIRKLYNPLERCYAVQLCIYLEFPLHASVMGSHLLSLNVASELEVHLSTAALSAMDISGYLFLELMISAFLCSHFPCLSYACQVEHLL